MKLIEKIKEDKILQKQREKEVKEEFLNEKKEKYEKSKKEKEEGEKKNILEKEKNKLLFEKKRKSEKENLKKLLLENEQNDKEYIKQKRSKIRSPQSNKSHKKNQNNEQDSIFNTISEFDNKEKDIKNQTMTNFYISKNVITTTKSTNISKKDKNEKKMVKSKSFRKTTKNQNKNQIEKSEQKLQEIKNNMEEIERKEKEEKEKKLLQKQLKIKNELKEKYLNNNCNIYRCAYCHKIPIININEFNHQIEIYCNNCKNKNYSFCSNYIFPYQYFEEKSLDHPIDNNLNCFYCKKNIDELSNENIYLNFCDICNDVICFNDFIIHKNQKHSNFKELKEKYNNLSLNIKNKKNDEKSKVKNKTKNNNENKNKLLTPAKSQTSLKKNTPKNDKNQKEEKKPINNKNNIPLSNNKKDNKKNNEKNKNTEKNNISNNNSEEKNTTKIPEEQIPIYLFDSCCIEHGKIYSNYCHDCIINICDICKEKYHKNHNLEKINDILVDEEKLICIKKSLEKDINDLDQINNYFNKLIEKIKEQYSYFYSLKKKEIDIKQKILKDYETIKYNYNTIQNVYNINYKNIIYNKESIISNLEKLNNNNNDILSQLNLIFNYLNESTKKSNLINYYNNINNYYIENGHWELTDIIKLDKNYIALSYFDGCIYIYDNISFNLNLICKVFDNNKGISQIIQLRNGDLACCGYEKIKILNINLDNKIYNISNEINIKNGSFTLVKELRNNYLITYDTHNKLKIWYKYKLVYVDNNNNINIDFLLKIKDYLFISLSNNNNKRQLNIFNINIEGNNCIKLNSFSLENISVIKQKNPLIKLKNNYIVALVSYEEEKLIKLILMKILKKVKIMKKITTMEFV